MTHPRVFEAYPDDPGRAAWKLVMSGVVVFGIIFTCGLLLDMYPTWTSSCGSVEKEIDIARGIYDSSTCLFYRGELSPEETRRWEQSAKAEGNAKCADALIVLGQNVFIMKLHHFFYQYIPWAPGTAFQTFKDVLLYLLGSTPVMYFITQAFYSLVFRMSPQHHLGGAPANTLSRLKEMAA